MSTLVVACLVVASVLAMGMATPVGAQEGITGQTIGFSVTEDGDVAHVDRVVEMDAQAYGPISATVTENGYDSVAEVMAEEDVSNGLAEEYTDARDVERNDGYDLEYRLFGVAFGNGLDITESDGAVTFRMEGPGTQGGDASTEYTVSVDMPGPITDSNADEVDGSVATWHLHDSQLETLTAETDPTGADEEEGSQNDDDDDGDGDGDAEDDQVTPPDDETENTASDDRTGDDDENDAAAPIEDGIGIGSADGSSSSRADASGSTADPDDSSEKTAAESSGAGELGRLSSLGNVVLIGIALIGSLGRLRRRL